MEPVTGALRDVTVTEPVRCDGSPGPTGPSRRRAENRVQAVMRHGYVTIHLGASTIAGIDAAGTSVIRTRTRNGRHRSDDRHPAMQMIDRVLAMG